MKPCSKTRKWEVFGSGSGWKQASSPRAARVTPRTTGLLVSKVRSGFSVWFVGVAQTPQIAHGKPLSLSLTLEMLPILAWNRLRNMNLALFQPFSSVIPAPALSSGSAGIGSTTRADSKWPRRYTHFVQLITNFG